MVRRELLPNEAVIPINRSENRLATCYRLRVPPNGISVGESAAGRDSFAS